MRLITLTSILLNSYLWQNAVAAESSSIKFTLKAATGKTCGTLSTDCTGDIATLDNFNTCRVNANKECALDLTVTDTRTGIPFTTIEAKKKAAIITIKKMEPLDNLILTSVKITVGSGDNLNDAKQLLVKEGAIADPTTSEKLDSSWKDTGCKFATDTFTCKAKQPIKGPFSLAVVKEGTAPVELTQAFDATVTLTRKGINAIPSFSGTEAKYKLTLEGNCKMPAGHKCSDDKIMTAAEVKDCLAKNKSADCKFTPTISFGSEAEIDMIETDFDANPLPVVFIDLKDLDATIVDKSKLTVTKLDFGIASEIEGAEDQIKLIVSEKLDKASLGSKGVTATVSSKGDVTGDYLTKATDGFKAGKFVYLNKGVEKGKFKPTIELQGEKKDNKPPVEYTVAASSADGASQTIPDHCKQKDAGDTKVITDIEKCVEEVQKAQSKMTFTWQYTQPAAAALTQGNTKQYPIVYFNDPAAALPDGQKFTITEISISQDTTEGCYPKDSKIFSGAVLASLKDLAGSSVTAADKKKFTTNIAATPGSYYQIQPAAGKANCEIKASVQISFTVQAVLDATKTTKPEVDPKKELETHAKWQKGALTAKITGDNTGANMCDLAKITQCSAALPTVQLIEDCIASLKKDDKCKDKQLSFTTTLNGGESTAIKVDNENAAAFEIKSIEGSNINLGLTKTDQGNKTPISVKITKIEGEVAADASEAVTYELFKLNYHSDTKVYAKGDKVGTAVKIEKNAVKFSVDLAATSIPLKSEMAFGLFKSTNHRSLLRSRRLLGETQPPVELKKIKIAVQSDPAKPSELNATPPTAAITKAPNGGMTGLINGGMFLTAATLLFSWVM